jgi:hypothetical protein
MLLLHSLPIINAAMNVISSFRLHLFNRTVADVIKVVKVHESTLRKRLNEFGETPASQLSLEEFMNIDLDAMTEEQDPPSFKAARKKDRERLVLLETESDFEDEISVLETEIEQQLIERRAKMKGPHAKAMREAMKDQLEAATASAAKAAATPTSDEVRDADRFIAEQTMGTIQELVTGRSSGDIDKELMPPPSPSRIPGVIASPGLGLKDTIQEYLVSPSRSAPSSAQPSTSGFSGKKEERSGEDGADDEDDDTTGDLDLTDIDDEEIDSYIMSEKEIACKTTMWMKVNAEYLKEKAEKDERERKEEEDAIREGREIKKKKPAGGKKQKVNLGGNQTAMEAIEKIVQEKKISTKINYDVLRNLNMPFTPTTPTPAPELPPTTTPEPSAPTVETASSSSKSDNFATSRPAAEKKKSSASSSSVFGISPLATPKGVNQVFAPALHKKRKGGEGESSAEAAGKSEGDAAGPAKRTRKVSEGPTPIVESGPVEPLQAEELVADEDVEDDEEECVSVAQLLSKHREDGGGDGDYEDYEEEEFD